MMEFANTEDDSNGYKASKDNSVASQREPDQRNQKETDAN